MEMPKFLLSKKFLIESVAFIFLFSVIFMTVYKPFSDTVWLGFDNLGFTIVFYLLAICLVSLSKWLIYHFQLKNSLTVFRFVLWIIAEYVIVAILYILCTKGQAIDAPEVNVTLVLKTSLCVGLILIVPYIFMTLYAAYRVQKEELEMLKLSYNAMLSEDRPSLLRFYDYKGELKFSVPPAYIYFMEAQDNYVNIHYDTDGHVSSYMLRCPTSKVESMIDGTSLVRCHRSYIVNLTHVRIFLRGHNSATLLLEPPVSKEISVSKSYYRKTLEKFIETVPAANDMIRRT